MQTHGTSSNDHVEISVVAPMHNEEGCVEEFLRRTDAALRTIGVAHEIVVVSDGSTDGTNRLLREGAARYPSLRVLILARNVGQCSALYAGIQASRGRVVIVTDGDLQHKPEDIHLLYGKMNEGFTLVSGSRKGRKESLLTKRFPSLVANWLLRQVTGCEVRDMGAQGITDCFRRWFTCGAARPPKCGSTCRRASPERATTGSRVRST
jgi:glycosyltransferase involved in cell wall biosynthesis